MMIKKNNIFNNLSIAQFMKKYWQKKPLLIRRAFPEFNDFLSKNKIISLACQRDTQARLVSFKKSWSLEDGPFSKSDFKKLQGHWTLLVQGVNYFFSEGEALLKKFNFLPHARLDDLMVSFAPDGGGVGPHFDSYDVFLLQGSGKRKWQIARKENFSLIPDLPLKIIENFIPTEEWVLEAGDMLYLPPNYAHNGIAVGDSITYSIGFRAPTHQEILNEFFIYLEDHCALDGIYEDPELKATKKPGKITPQMIKKIMNVLTKIRFTQEDVENFYGRYVSEPKPHLTFSSPKINFKKNDFIKLAIKNGICLNAKTQMLYTAKKLFLNGEMYPLKIDKEFFKKLADYRENHMLSSLNQHSKNLLYEWYLDGYLEIKC